MHEWEIESANRVRAHDKEQGNTFFIPTRLGWQHHIFTLSELRMFASNRCTSGAWYCTIHHSVFLEHSRIAEVLPEVTGVINRGSSDNKMLWHLISQWGSVLHSVCSVCVFFQLWLVFLPLWCLSDSLHWGILREVTIICITCTCSCPLCLSAFLMLHVVTPHIPSSGSEQADRAAHLTNLQ